MGTALEQLQARVIPGAEILAVYIDGFVVGKRRDREAILPHAVSLR
jgi:NhaP-type Na+/H+ and K+/H+ antiporter